MVLSSLCGSLQVYRVSIGLSLVSVGIYESLESPLVSLVSVGLYESLESQKFFLVSVGP